MPKPERWRGLGRAALHRFDGRDKPHSMVPRSSVLIRFWNASEVGFRRIGYLACAGVSMLLLACSTLPTGPSQKDTLTLTGRVSVRIEATTSVAEKSFTASFALGGSDSQGHIELTSPLGTVLALARWMPEGAWLATSQGQSPYPSMQQLTREVFGETIPVAPWFDWLRGKPWPGAASEPRADSLPGFVQDGWTVDLERLPDRLIVARREQPPAVTLRIKLDAND